MIDIHKLDEEQRKEKEAEFTHGFMHTYEYTEQKDKLKESSIIYSLMPSSLQNSTIFTNASLSIDEFLKETEQHINDGLFYDLEKQSSLVLDHLAAQWHAYFWRDTWDKPTKIKVLKSIIQEKRLLGTLYAVKQMLKALGIKHEIIEWFEEIPKAYHHTFKVVLDVTQFNQGFPSNDEFKDMCNAIDYAKNVRSQYTFLYKAQITREVQLHHTTRTAIFVRAYNF